MNNPNATDADTDACDEGLLEDLEAWFMELARKGDYDAVTFAILESDSFMSILKGVAMSILKNKAVGHKTLMEGLSMYAAPQWAAKELPKRIASMKAAHEECMDEAESAEVT